MFNTGKCPKCDAVVHTVSLESITVAVSYASTWNGVSFVCQSCRAVLGVSIDPIAIKTDIINAIQEAVGRRK